VRREAKRRSNEESAKESRQMYLIIFFAFLIISAILIFMRKLVLKRRLRRVLGRKVEDRELTSINAWMETGSDPTQSAAPRQTSGRGRGDHISLVLAETGLVLIPLSIFASRASNSPWNFYAAYTAAILFVIVGLPLGLIALARAKRLPGIYGSGKKAQLAILANLALGGCVLVITMLNVFWSQPLDRFLAPERYNYSYSLTPSLTPSPTPGSKSSTKGVARKKREDLIHDVNAEWLARKMYDVTALPMGDNGDQLVISSFGPLPRSTTDPLAKELITKKGKEFTDAGFYNTFKFEDRRAAVSATYEFKSIDVQAREIALTATELWFLSQHQITTKATLDAANDTRLVISSSAFTDENQTMLTVEFAIKNSKGMKGLGFADEFTVTNGKQSWIHHLY
jgi:hypothetical protein